MLELMRLEFQKYKLGSHWKGVALALLGCMLFVAACLLNNSMDATTVRYTYEDTFKATQLLLAIVFLLYAAVILATIVVGEYNNRTILVLFCYPISRRKLILAKLLVVSLFTMVTMAVGFLCCTALAIFLDARWDMVDGVWSMAVLMRYLPTAAVSIASCGAWCLLPFSVGMQHKSVPATVASSILTVFARQVIITLNPVYAETWWQYLLILLGISVLTAVTARHQVDILD